MVKNLLRLGFVFLMISSLVNVSSAMSQLESGVETVGQKATNFSLEDTDGNKIDTAQVIGKIPVIFFFWTTWCPHCQSQIKQLKAEVEDIKKTGGQLILIDIDESKSQVINFLKSANAPFASLLDKDARVAEMYKVIGVPTFVIVGSDGIIKFHDNLLSDNYQKFLKEN
ncbi:MAG: TlpA disulfide reductase family protein [Candidatus Omnitrophota bacterium]|nr:TlpA disulfide reductase family protein [Candidatus Omnitrophota bacterium]